ncbi:MAG TPA: DNA polymerase Y family protein [Terriglobia bacterium]|jgi:protein ImuB|nr:DNA polymerase Y family protein [Terriglobia bacterium]
MNFACLYIPDFHAQAVVRCEPELRGRALAVVEAAPPPFRVFALNEAARRAGAEPGMSRVEVAELPGVEVRRRSPAAETSAHAALLDLARSFSPRIEDLAVDTVTLDLAGGEALLGPPEKIALRLRECASGLGLEANAALAPNPDAARLAARGFAGITLIGAGEETERLGDLPVAVLDPAPAFQETLERWGIRTFRALAALPAAELSERLGQEGIRLQRLARGAALRALVPAPESLQFEEAMDLDYPIAELDPLAFILGRLLNQLCARLSARGRATQELRLMLGIDSSAEGDNATVDSRQSTVDSGNESRESKARGRNGRELSAFDSSTFDSSTFDSFDLFQPRVPSPESRVLRLPVPMRDPRLLLKLWLLDLEARPPSRPILKVLIEAEPAWPRVAQGDLFLPRAPDPQKLELTLARLKGVVGEDRAGSPELLDTHRPDAFRMSWFAVKVCEDGSKAKLEGRGLKVKSQKAKGKKQRAANSSLEPQFSKPDPQLPSPDPRPSMALRLFRPPLAAEVELRDGRPVRVEAQRVRGPAVRGPVTSAAGPWRTSGDWWTDQPWEHDEWDVEIAVVSRQLSVVSSAGPVERVESRRSKVEKVQLYRIHRDLRSGQWFVGGLYD